MWRKNPIIALIFYLEFMAAFTSPLILFTVYVFTPIWLHDFFLPMLYLFGQVLIGLAAGLDFKAREKETKDWKYNMLMNVMDLPGQSATPGIFRWFGKGEFHGFPVCGTARGLRQDRCH